MYYFDHLRIVTVKEVGAYAEQVLQVGSVRSLVVDSFTVDSFTARDYTDAFVFMCPGVSLRRSRNHKENGWDAYPADV